MAKNSVMNFWAKAQASHRQYLCLKENCANNDWLITTCFYTALQIVKSLMYAKGFSPDVHADYKQFLKSKKKAVFHAYIHLHDRAQSARYDVAEQHVIMHQDSDVKQAEEHLAIIAEYVASQNKELTDFVKTPKAKV